MRWGITIVAGVIGLGLTVGCERQTASESTTEKQPSNLVLITIDTLRADHLGYSGYSRATSPAIDRLADSGTVFSAAQVQWTKTSPSIASFLTGTYPATNRIQHLRARLDDKLVTIAEIMKANGYATSAFVSNVNAGSLYNFQQGFDEFHEMWDKSNQTPTQNQGTDFFPNEKILALVTDWMKQQSGDKPFFLWVHLLDPHGPYTPPERYAGQFKSDELLKSQADIPPDDRVPNYQRVPGLRTRGEFIAAYDEEILSSDDVVDGIVKQLDIAKQREKTLVVLSADHGESFGEHQYWFNHGKYTYQATANVPLIFSQPSVVPAQKRIDTPVGLIDLLPTIVDVLQVDPGQAIEQFQGMSVIGALAGDEVKDRPIYTQGREGQLAVRVGRWKYIYDPRASTPEVPVIAVSQLYDLATDPAETTNLVQSKLETANQLHKLLQEWAEFIKQWELGIKEKPLDDALSPADRARLKSLGYLGEE